MKKDTKYIQCALKRNGQNHMAWIPKKFAVKGKFLKIEKGNQVEDGWEVMSIGDGSEKSFKDVDTRNKNFGASIH